MTIELKLGRWRNEAGAERNVVEKVDDNHWRDDGGQRYYRDGRHRCLGSCNLNLTEYLGPLETDLAAFIAGLQPGDVYADLNGFKQQLIGRHPETGALVVASGKGSFTLGKCDARLPAGPWVEPPKPREQTVELGLYDFNGTTGVNFVSQLGNSRPLLGRKTVTITEGEGMP